MLHSAVVYWGQFMSSEKTDLVNLSCYGLIIGTTLAEKQKKKTFVKHYRCNLSGARLQFSKATELDLGNQYFSSGIQQKFFFWHDRIYSINLCTISNN